MTENNLLKRNGPSLRYDLLSVLISRSVVYCLSILFFLFLSIRLSGNYLYDYILNIINNPIERERLLDPHSFGSISSLRTILGIIFYVDDHFFLFGIVISFLFLWYYTNHTRISFICPHCLKTIYFKDIKNIFCFLCQTDNHSRFDLLLYCSNCHDKINFLDCPQCNNPIDICNPYDEISLRKKRREKAKVAPHYIEGLREIYARNKRLPKFICKHCLRTLITRNYNVICPHCGAEYLVTDNKTQVQIGDVKIKGFRHIVDESTMERVLFESCLQCGGIIEAIKCYHHDCGEVINLRESYDEVELLRRRHE